MKNKKSLGQHWLKNRLILDEIADLALADGCDTCLEIGPGLGTLTSSLLRRFQKVIAVEYDENLAANLPKSFPGKNLQIIHGDILTTDLASIAPAKYVAAGNIPYYITSPIIKKLLSATPLPQKVVLLIQKEVAERIAADVGDHSLLSLYVSNLAEIALGPVVPAEEFTPPPKVASQVIVLTPRPAPQVAPEVIDFAKLGFSAPRKKLVANLSAATTQGKDFWRSALIAQNLSPDARAQDLSLEDWQHLQALNPAGHARH